MTGLERRLGRLETMTGIGIVHPTIFVSFVGPGDLDRPRPVASATVNGCVWHRAEGEAEAAFLARVRGEAKPICAGCGIVGFLD